MSTVLLTVRPTCLRLTPKSCFRLKKILQDNSYAYLCDNMALGAGLCSTLDHGQSPIILATLFFPVYLITSSLYFTTYCYTDLAVFVAVTIASTHFGYTRRDDQAELAWVASLNTEMVQPITVAHLSTCLLYTSPSPRD